MRIWGIILILVGIGNILFHFDSNLLNISSDYRIYYSLFISGIGALLLYLKADSNKKRAKEQADAQKIKVVNDSIIAADLFEGSKIKDFTKEILLLTKSDFAKTAIETYCFQSFCIDMAIHLSKIENTLKENIRDKFSKYWLENVSSFIDIDHEKLCEILDNRMDQYAEIAKRSGGIATVEMLFYPLGSHFMMLCHSKNYAHAVKIGEYCQSTINFVLGYLAKIE